MTFCGGKMADGGFETVGSGSGVDICGRMFDSLFPLRDFLSDFMGRIVNARSLTRLRVHRHVILRRHVVVLCKQIVGISSPPWHSESYRVSPIEH